MKANAACRRTSKINPLFNNHGMGTPYNLHRLITALQSLYWNPYVHLRFTSTVSLAPAKNEDSGLGCVCVSELRHLFGSSRSKSALFLYYTDRRPKKKKKALEQLE